MHLICLSNSTSCEQHGPGLRQPFGFIALAFFFRSCTISEHIVPPLTFAPYLRKMRISGLAHALFRYVLAFVVKIEHPTCAEKVPQ